MCSESIKTEAVYTKTEMNSEQNIHFLQNVRCVEKVLRLNLYLLRHK